MKLYTYIDNGREILGAENPDNAMVDLLAASGGDVRFASMMALIEAGEPGLDLARKLVETIAVDWVRPMAGLQLAAPIPRPWKLRGSSVFERHLKQSAEGAARRMAANAPDPESAFTQISQSMGLDKIPGQGWYRLPAYYYMDVGSVTGSGTAVTWPAYSNWIDYELELVAVIGKPGKDIAREAANRHIFGYTMLNDLSARDAQLEAMGTGMGAAKGKDFENSTPMGPCIVTADDIADPYALKVKVRVDGEEWAASDGSEAIFKFDQCIAYASQSQTVHAGEMFSTGTLPSCSSMEMMRTVERGAKIEFEVEKIGVLRTEIGK